jgi:predicted dinucleotide-utilizing enzyme
MPRRYTTIHKGGRKSMERQNIAIIGLGRIGSAFLSEMLGKTGRGINLACVSEVFDTPGKEQAQQANLKIITLDEIVAMGDRIDIIFDLTGIQQVRTELRAKLVGSNNNHTIIASETIARLIWALIAEHELPTIEGRKTGY